MFLRFSRRVFSQSVAAKPLITENLGQGIYMFSLNRGAARNALSAQLVEDLQDAIRDNNEARCVIVRSAVAGMFCAGADLKERKGMSEEQAKEFVRELRATFTMLEQMMCPTISVIDGPALGGGCELALCTDIRVATKDALFGLPETGLAIIPGAGGTQRLPRLIGISKAKELIFTGDRVSANEALAMGLVNHVCDDFNLATEKAIEIAKKIGDKGPIAIRAAKKAIDGGEADDLRKGLEIEDKQYQKVLNTEDRLEGLKAFAEKRKPVYHGK